MGGDVLIEPAVEEHVADGGAHGDQVEAEERKTVKPMNKQYKISTPCCLFHRNIKISRPNA